METLGGRGERDWAGVAGSLAASAAICAWGSYIGAAALALVLGYAAPIAAGRLIARAELMATDVR